MTQTTKTESRALAEIRMRILDEHGNPRPGMTTLPNSVLAKLLDGFGDCASCPVLAEGIRLQLERAQELERNLRGVGEWL
jgi:hypothetical protein